MSNEDYRIDDVDIFNAAVAESGLPITVNTVAYCKEIFEATQQDVPNVLIIDGSLHDKTMLECIGLIKADEATRQLPLFVLTGHNKFLGEKCIAAGVVEYYEKPMQMQAFVEIVNETYEAAINWNREPSARPLAENDISDNTRDAS